MCNPWARDRYLEYAAVFQEIAEILTTSGVKARVKDNADNTGLLVEMTLRDGRTAVLDESDGENWSIAMGGTVVRLDVPVESRDAKIITAAVLQVVRK